MNRSLALLLTATIALGSAQAFAQVSAPPAPPAGEAPQGGPPHGPGGPAGGPRHFFEDADANKDGFLTKDEMRSAQDKKLDEMFARLDTDKDGKLSKEELQKGHEEMRAKMRERFEQRKAQKDDVKKDDVK